MDEITFFVFCVYVFWLFSVFVFWLNVLECNKDLNLNFKATKAT